MTSILEYKRHKERFQKELFRRIGYTNTLYDIFRFGDIVKVTCSLFPISQTVLVTKIRKLRPELADVKYATGIIDLLCAFNITKRVGQRVALTYRGRALAAVAQQTWYENVRSHFFLKAVLESDGDYLLNLLILVPGTKTDSEAVKALGMTFFRRILELLHRRRDIVSTSMSDKLIREVALKQIDLAEDSIRYDILNEPRPTKRPSLEERLKLLQTKKPIKKRAENEPTETLRHTIDPRRGWLSDLGLVTKDEEKKYQLTSAASSLLSQARIDGFELGEVFAVPFSKPLADALNMRNIATIADDYFQRLAVHVYSNQAPVEYSSSPQDFLEDIRFFFELTRLKRFNQAEIPALYECMVLKAASEGKMLSSEHFQQQLDDMLNSYASQVYRVAGRYGQEGYLSFRRRSYG